MMDVIPDPEYLQHLQSIMSHLATWEESPVRLNKAAYQWCSAIAEKLGNLGLGGIPPGNRLPPHRPRSRGPQDETAPGYTDLLLTALKVGFRRSESRNSDLEYTPHHERMFDIAFSSDDDDVIADAARAWVVDPDRAEISSFVRYLAKRMEVAAPFSPRLRQTIIRVIQQARFSDNLKAAGLELETARLLDRLDLDVGEAEGVDHWVWQQLLVSLVRSPTGRKGLSSNCWRLLGKLAVGGSWTSLTLNEVEMEVLRSLYDAEDWEKLEAWMLTVWPYIGCWSEEWTKDVEQMTLELFQRRSSAISRFEDLCAKRLRDQYADRVRQMCNQARAEQVPPVSSSS